MSINAPNIFQAGAFFQVPGGVLTVVNSRGIIAATAQRLSPGIYSFPLIASVDFQKACAFATAISGASAPLIVTAGVSSLNNNVAVVVTDHAGVAADPASCWFGVMLFDTVG